MAISINWKTKVIFVPKADLTLISGTLYEHDSNVFRLALKALEASPAGMPFDRTHTHATEVTVAGTTYFRSITIINGYSVEYENGAYSVKIVGSNNNIWDIQNGILVQNNVQVIPTNTAGGQVITVGSGVTTQDISDIINGVWNQPMTSNMVAGTFGAAFVWVKRIWQRFGFDSTSPVVNKTDGGFTVDNVTVVGTTDGNGNVTQTRQ